MEAHACLAAPTYATGNDFAPPPELRPDKFRGLNDAHHARFVNLIWGPRTLLEERRALTRWQPAHSAGHNPGRLWPTLWLMNLGLLACPVVASRLLSR
ncbi:MAG: hypothetical protein AB1421_07215 [Pseudomonadota bacterium]